LKEIQYINGIETEEECIEWHALYQDKEMNLWKFDMIHIRKGSKYDGTVEKVTDAITKRLTPDIRRTILQIKYDVPDGIMIPVEIISGETEFISGEMEFVSPELFAIPLRKRVSFLVKRISSLAKRVLSLVR
jgi:hypothetical protein